LFFECTQKFSEATGSKATWQVIKDIGMGSSPTSKVYIDNLNELNHKFVPDCNGDNSCDTFCDTASSRAITPPCDILNNVSSLGFSFSCVDQTDVLQSILKIKSNAVGLDLIHPKFLKLILPFILLHITHIFNTALMTSTFPDIWKNAKVIPIPKSSSDFRPISILPFLSKALENIIYDQMNKHLTDNSLLSNKQSGFRPSRSCITALVDVSENIRRNMDQNKITFLLLLDHTKAFDSIDHPVEINKLKSSFGFSTSAADLIKSYLTQRSQVVSNNNKFSKPLYLNKGVLQGSILGPILFLCYINDLSTQLENCN